MTSDEAEDLTADMALERRRIGQDAPDPTRRPLDPTERLATPQATEIGVWWSLPPWADRLIPPSDTPRGFSIVPTG